MKDGTTYSQKDIVLIPFPYSDLTGSKQRPALIISNESLNTSEDKICCLITSNKPKDGIEISKNDFERGDLPFQSWVKPYRLFTVNEKIIRKKLCVVRSSFYKKILGSINGYLEEK